MENIIHQNRVTLSACASAVTSLCIGYPLDKLKTLLQVHKFNSTASALKSTIYHEGFRGLYTGIAPLLVTSTALRVLAWNLFNNGKTKLKDLKVTGVLSSVIAGGGTGCIVSIASSPIDLLKVQRQLCRIEGIADKSFFKWVGDAVRSGGIRSLYRGYRLQLPMDCLGTMVYFGVYESVKNFGRDGEGKPRVLVSIAGGALAGCSSWTVVFPLDLVKSLVQREGLTNGTKSITSLVKERYLEMGFRGFYRGLSMQLIRAVPVHALNFLVYETVLEHCTCRTN